MRANRSVSWVGVVFALTLGITSLSARSEDGCTKDTDCKGERVCDAGQCVDPNKASNSFTDWLKAAKAAADAAADIAKDVHGINGQSGSAGNPPAAAPNQPPATPNRPTLAYGQQAAPAYRPTPALTMACATPIGVCRMPQAVPQGTFCGCITPNGVIRGIAR